MRAGKFDRRIRIEQDVGVEDEGTGTTEPSWVAVATVWAEVQDVLPSRGESQANDVRQSVRPARVRIRWDVNLAQIGVGAMRIVQIDRGDRMLKVTGGPAEMGRREALEFMAEEFSTPGNA